MLHLNDDYRVVLLPRGEIQKAYYKHNRFNGLDVVETSLGLAEIIADCDLFVGAGGTMTREAAVLGIPTISIYQDALLDVDQYLIENGFMVHMRELTARMVRDFLKESSRKPADTQLLHKGRSAFAMIKGAIAKGASPNAKCGQAFRENEPEHRLKSSPLLESESLILTKR